MNFKKAFAVLTAIITLLCVSTASANSITLCGTVDPDARGLTVLVTENDAEITTLASQQILYLNQYGINSDGSFAVSLPLFEQEYKIRTNAYSLEATEPKQIVLYVDPTNGSDTNSGTSADAPFKSISKIYGFAGIEKKVVLLGDTEFVNAQSAYTENIIISGNTGSEKLTLPSSVSLKGNLTIEKVNLVLTAASTIYANAHSFKINNDVTADSTYRMAVYGGSYQADCTGDTDITLLAGYYNRVYGGGYQAKINGNTNVVFGGTANAGDGIDDDDTSTISPCYIYGGGNNGSVTGETNITLQDNAVTRYVVGTGEGSASTVPVANVFIKGGKVMNVYGSRNAPSEGCRFNITMTGGLAEAVFGGCESASMTGSTFVNLLGGEVARRVYTGCYNDTNLFTWSSDYYVTGTTYLTIAPGVSLSTGIGLTTTNDKLNMGVFSGSRTKSSHSNEVNTIIFLDGCYDTYKGQIGGSLFSTYQTYTIGASEGGDVTGATTGGKVHIVPDGDKYGVFNGTPYKETDITLSSGHNTVEFKDDFKIHSAIASIVDSKVNAVVNLSANNLFNEKNPTAYVAVYDEFGNLVSCRLAKTDAATGEYSFDMGNVFEKGKTYVLNVMIWDEDQKPLVNVYEITVQ